MQMARLNARIARYVLFVLVYGLPSAVAAGPAVSGQPAPPVERSEVGYLRVKGDTVWVPIPRMRTRLDPAVRVPCLIETDGHFFVVLEKANVCAFAKVDNRGEPTGWLGESGIVFFYRAVRSERADMPLAQGVELPVLVVDPKGYRVRVGAGDVKGTLYVAKSLAGVFFHKESLLDEYQRLHGPSVAARRPAPTRPGTAREIRVPARQVKKRVPIVRDRVSPAPALVWARAPRPETEPERRPPRFRAPNAFEGFAGATRACVVEYVVERGGRLLGRFLYAGLIVGGGMLGLWWVIRILRGGIKPLRRIRAKTASDQSAAATQKELASSDKQASGHEISGSLETVQMVDMIQFLNSTHQNGTLLVGDPADPVARAVFLNGEIVAAKSGLFDGEDAVYAMLRQSKGLFVFFRGTVVVEGRRIDKSTVALLMEGCRRRDEDTKEKTDKATGKRGSLKERLRTVLKKKISSPLPPPSC